MNYKIIQISDDTWRIEDGGVRFFLLEGKKKALLIDSGMTVNNAKDIAMSLTDLPVELLNTHADRDHIGSNEQFASFYMHPLEEDLYRRSGKSGDIIPVKEGDVIDLGERELKIIDLPGHTPGSIAVLDVRNRVLISGDPIQRNGRIFMFGSHRNMNEYIRSLERLEKRTDEFDEIWPSHADIPVSTDTIEMLRKGAMDILSGKIEGKQEEVHGHSIVAYDLGSCTMLCDR
ncbi:MAG: MBL fold metallo-hydrolase [Erysipelotrichaceae bacterium]|nr:MBL fold metallo-hydrolase [Erysipelotrichaceae bacterium]